MRVVLAPVGACINALDDMEVGGGVCDVVSVNVLAVGVVDGIGADVHV